MHVVKRSDKLHLKNRYKSCGTHHQRGSAGSQHCDEGIHIHPIHVKVTVLWLLTLSVAALGFYSTFIIFTSSKSRGAATLCNERCSAASSLFPFYSCQVHGAAYRTIISNYCYFFFKDLTKSKLHEILRWLCIMFYDIPLKGFQFYGPYNYFQIKHN